MATSAEAELTTAAGREAEHEAGPVRWHAGETVIGAPILDRGGETLGFVRDLLFEPSTGELVSAVLAPRAAGREALEVPVDYGSLEWLPATGRALAFQVRTSSTEVSAAATAGYEGLFDGRDVMRVSGEIKAMEAASSGLSRALILKVQDDENLLHRVLVENGELASRRWPELEPASVVEFEGIFTRDDTGKLLVASAFKHGGETVELRDFEGAVLWPQLAEHLLSASSLEGRWVSSADGQRFMIRGLLVDSSLGTVSHVRLEVGGVGGVERNLPWLEVERDEADAWSVALDSAALAALPAAP